MAKLKGKKNFMNLNASECMEAYKCLMDNAGRLYNDAFSLADQNSYGLAISILIHSLEESMKAFIIFLDGKGFLFRNRVKGISNLFVNHKLRYALALVITLFAILIDDFKKLVPRIKKSYILTFDLKKDKEQIEGEISSYLETRLKTAIEEVQWFSEAEFLRQDGFYVDYVDGIKTPLSISQNDFEETSIRIKRIRAFIIDYMDGFNSKDDIVREGIENLKTQFSVENWYEKIAELIELFGNPKKEPFEQLSFLLNNSTKDEKSN